MAAGIGVAVWFSWRMACTSRSQFEVLSSAASRRFITTWLGWLCSGATALCKRRLTCRSLQW